MLEQLGETARKLSFALMFAALFGGCYAEGSADVPVARDGKPKPPMSRQRATYLLVFGAGVPGVAWGIVRAFRGEQKTPWD